MDEKSVAIITRHAVPNYGSFFQALATEYLFEGLGYVPRIIDYRRKDETPQALIDFYVQRKKNIVSYLYYNILWRFSHFCIERKLSYARKRYLYCTDPVTEETVKECINDFSVLVTGSDQVWNLVGSGKTEEIDGNYFWKMADSGCKIFSYAASFGDSKISESDFRKCAGYLKRFKKISVREDTGVLLVKKMGMEARQVLDPTLVIHRDYWINIAGRCRKKRKRPYALIYNLHSDSNMYQAIETDLEGSGLDVVSITSTFRGTLGERVFCPAIEEFLGLFANAKCIYADSFHAIAFSIIYKVPFLVILPRQYSTRLESVLRLFGLEERVNGVLKGKAWDESLMDWNSIYNILEDEKRISMEWLKAALDSFNQMADGKT